MAVATLKISLRWRNHDGRSWSCECMPEGIDWPIWSHLGSIYYADGGWFWRLLNKNRYWCIANTGTRIEKCATLEEAKQWVEDNSQWP